MTRLEAAVRSPISFRRRLGSGTTAFAEPPETCGINFDGRLFVWHAFSDEPFVHPVFGHRELGPTVSTVLHDADDFEAAATELERFLSTIAFYYDQEAETLAYGTAAGDDPWESPVTRSERRHVGWMVTEPYEAMFLQREPQLLLALGYFREGLNAGSPFYRFLAFWNCLDAIFDTETARNDFLDAAVPEFQRRWDDRYSLPRSPAKYFRTESRNALAHVLRKPGRRTIDPDASQDRRRIDHESAFLRLIARAAIERMFPASISAADKYPRPRYC